ncbi:MAG: RDD family protein [Pseudomonadota bacterium]
MADAEAVAIGRARRAARAAREKAEARQAKSLRPLVTPEGAVLNLRLASAGERAGAFLLDFALQILLIFCVIWGIGSIVSAMDYDGWRIAFALAMVLIFFIRNFYFILFELTRKAATPGKRALGLRVAARSGGRLKANAIIARNLMRELEVFLPLSALFGLGQTGVNGWINLLLLIWAGLFLFFPLFNKDKLRVGDLIAGTIVIHAPKVRLLADITSEPSQGQPQQSAFTFTTAELDAYGIHELHVLEDILRHSTPKVKREVTEKIMEKIGWTKRLNDTPDHDVQFLESYYAALRRHLEQRLLFGERKKDKYDKG